MTPSEKFPGRPDIVIIELGNFTIKNLFDVERLFVELDSLGDDFPNMLPIFHIEASDGNMP